VIPAVGYEMKLVFAIICRLSSVRSYSVLFLLINLLRMCPIWWYAISS